MLYVMWRMWGVRGICGVGGGGGGGRLVVVAAVVVRSGECCFCFPLPRPCTNSSLPFECTSGLSRSGWNAVVDAAQIFARPCVVLWLLLLLWSKRSWAS